jgi:drug/metabolite transporter (DMT)-like permease
MIRSMRASFARAWNAAVLLLVLTNLFWAASMIVARAVHELVPPVALAFWRWTIALALVLPFAWPHLQRDLPVLLRNWALMLVLGSFGIGAYNTFTYFGLQTTTALNALLMQSATPLVILLCSFLLFRERPRPLQVAAVLVSLLGVLVIAARGSLAALLSLSFNRGDAFILLGIAIYSVYAVLLRRRPSVHPLSFLGATFAIGTLNLLPFYLWERGSGAVLHATPGALLGIVFLGVFPAFIAYLFFNRGVELIGANRAGHFIHLIPVFGSLIAVVALGESFLAYHLVGILLIAAGIVLATVRVGAPSAAAVQPRPVLRGD